MFSDHVEGISSRIQHTLYHISVSLKQVREAFEKAGVTPRGDFVKNNSAVKHGGTNVRSIANPRKNAFSLD